MVVELEMRARHERFKRAPRLLIAVAAAASIAGVAVARWSSHFSDPVRRLVDARGAKSRDIEPRISGGFPWAPFHKSSAGEPAPDRFALLKTAADVVGLGNDRSSPSTRHAKALARILTGDPQTALATLESLDAGADPAVANDVAAAQYVIALREGDPSRLQRALVAVDTALQSNPHLAEARFNRALIIEALGLRDLARDEWQSYVQLDPSSPWSMEARTHMAALPVEEDFDRALKREYERLAGDPSAARAFGLRYRQRTRFWAESEVLGDWAESLKNGAPDRAAKHLRLAREVGITLASNDGDPLLSALVSAIEGADAPRRSILADAHLRFRDALRVYRDRRPNDAKPLLVAAGEAFKRGQSPGELRTRHFLACTLFLQGKIVDADRQMRELLVSLGPAFPAERADALWIVAAAAVSETRWDDVIVAWTECLAIYERLGEVENAATIRQQLAFTFDRLGDRSRAWGYRMAAMRQLGRRVSLRQQEAIGSVARAAMMDRDWRTAQSFARLEVEVGRRVDHPSMLVESLLYRAEVYAHLRDPKHAAEDLAEARRHAMRIADPSFRASSEIISSIVSASVVDDPREAIALLTKAIDFHATKGRRMYLPDIFRRRGLAYRALHDDAAAAADFDTGIAELERHRESAAPGQDRWSVFHAAGELFGEAIALALDRRDAQAAFDYSERERARGLFDTLHSQWQSVRPGNIPASTTLIEYSIHGDSMAIFVVDERGVRSRREPIDRAWLHARIAGFNEAGRQSEMPAFREAARALYGRLIAPIENELIGRQALAIVPDPEMEPLPFGALVDGANRHLVETYAVAIEPSAAFFATLRDRLPREGATGVLVVAGGDDGGRLTATGREVRAIAALYPAATLLDRERATPETFIQHAREARAIHFAGHGVASSKADGDGYLVFTPASADGRLDLEEIAAMDLPRTSLVVLAACDTARGQTRSSEGTISVARAFLAAGVPTVIATLWPIDDEAAAEFFPVLHQKLARGAPARDALRATQLEWIRRGDRTAALWAALEVIGE